MTIYFPPRSPSDRYIKLVPAVMSSLILGLGLGFVPGLNHHLDWVLWFVIPVGGFLFGMVAGWIQFGACYFLDQRIDRLALRILPLAALLGYALTDCSIYLSTTIHLKDTQSIAEGNYRLSDLMSFGDYMSWRLGSSTVLTRHGEKLYNLGRIGTTLSYFVNLAGVILGGLGGLLTLVDEFPYWWRPGKEIL